MLIRTGIERGRSTRPNLKVGICGEHDVELEGAATAMFTDGATATGNRGFDLVCSSGSVAGAAKGMHPVIGRQKCQTWTQLRGYPTWLEDLLGP